MARTELPWLLLGRKVRPFSFALSVATFILGAVILGGGSVWGGADPWSLMVAVLAWVATGLLWAGFWVPSSVLMQHGLMLAAMVFAARGAYIGMQPGVSTWWTAALSWSWTLAAGGSWLLERTTGSGDDAPLVLGQDGTVGRAGRGGGGSA